MTKISGLTLFVLLVCAQLSHSSVARGSDFAMVVHSSIPVMSIENKVVRQIYTGDATQWPDGKRVRIAQLGDESVLTASFLLENLHMSVADFNQKWRYLLFSGRAIPPKKFDSEEALMQFVRDTPGAIGYVNKKADISKWGLKIIDVSKE